MKPKRFAPLLSAAATLVVAISVTPSANANTLAWDGSDSTAWATGANWTGDVAPANSLFTDIALFNLSSYTNQPDAGTTSINGIQVGGSSGALTIGGTSLSIGTGGITVAAGAGATTLSAPITLGATQTWTNNSSNLLTVGSISRGIGATVNFAPGTGGIQTTNTNTNGILGGWATLGNSGASGATADWATVDGSGNISAYTGYTDIGSGNQTGAGASTQNWRTVNTGAVTTLTTSATINSLVVRSDFSVSNGATATLDSGGLILSGISRWILNNGAGSTAGTGQLTSGTSELFIDVASSTADANNWRIWTKIVDNGAGAVNVVKHGPGLVTLSNANTYTGDTYINSGTLAAGITNAFGTTGTVRLNGGTLSNASAAAAVTLSNNIVVSGTNAIQLGANLNMQLNGGLSGSGSLTLGNSGNNSSVFLNGANTMTSGTITFANNTNSVRLQNASFGNANVAWVFNNATANRSTLDFTTGTIHFGSMTGSGRLQGNAAGGTKTISAGALGLNDTFSGVIADGAGTIALTKVGTGTMTLSGANTFTGATTINAGTLALASTGSIASNQITTASGATFDVSAVASYTVTTGKTLTNNGTVNGSFTVASGGTLNGSGTFNNAVTVNGALNPGNSPGSQTYAAGLTLGAASTTTMEIAGLGGVAGTDFDFINVTGGTLTFDGTLNIVDFGGHDISAQTAAYNLFDFVTSAGDFDTVTVDGASLAYNVETDTWSSTVGDVSYNFAEGTAVLSVTVVPEPAAALLGSLGLLGLLRRRRTA